MIADGILATHNGTGGTGALTLVSVPGYPTFSNAFIGTRFVYYSIAEYTDASKATLKQREAGIGSLVTSSGVLTRTKVQSSWDGTNYLPKFGTATAPTAINFGNTAANIDILCAPSSANSVLPIQAYVSGSAGTDSVGLPGLSVQITSTFTLTGGTIYYCPVQIVHLGPFSVASLRVTTGTTGSDGGLYVGLYEISASTGLPTNLLVAFGNVGSTGTTAPFTLANSPIATPVFLTPGWYYLAVLWVAGSATGSPALMGNIPLTGPAGMSFSSGGIVTALTLTAQTALTDPAVAPTASASLVSVPTVAFK